MKGISVVIPTYNRGKYLNRLLDCLIKQNYKPYEIIVVNDGSTDNTNQIIDEYRQKHKNITLLEQQNKGPAGARNTGIRKAKYDIVAFTDDDCLPKKNWLKKIAHYYSINPKLAGVGGIAYTPEEWIKPLTHHALPLNEAKKNALKFRFPPTCNVSYKKSQLIKAGLFHENFTSPTTEDVDLFIRISKKGKVIFDRNLIMPHLAGKSTVRKEIKRFKDFYEGFEEIEKKYPKEFKQIYASKNTKKKFTEMALSLPSLKKIVYYKPYHLINPITFIKITYLFLATRLFVIKKRLFS